MAWRVTASVAGGKGASLPRLARDGSDAPAGLVVAAMEGAAGRVSLAAS